MEWCRISTGTELVRVATDEIVYVRAGSNYSNLELTNDKADMISATFQSIPIRNGKIYSQFCV